MIRAGESFAAARTYSDSLGDELLAELIALAVNSHEPLVGALRDAQIRLHGAGLLGGADDPINTALANAERRPTSVRASGPAH